MIASALLVDLATWQWLFTLPIALVAVAFMITLRVVPNSRDRVCAPFDIAGALLSIVGIGGIVLGIHEGPRKAGRPR